MASSGQTFTQAASEQWKHDEWRKRYSRLPFPFSCSMNDSTFQGFAVTFACDWTLPWNASGSAGRSFQFLQATMHARQPSHLVTSTNFTYPAFAISQPSLRCRGMPYIQGSSCLRPRYEVLSGLLYPLLHILYIRSAMACRS